jgi:hypothetical protein
MSLFWGFGAPGTPQATGPTNLPGQPAGRAAAQVGPVRAGQPARRPQRPVDRPELPGGLRPGRLARRGAGDRRRGRRGHPELLLLGPPASRSATWPAETVAYARTSTGYPSSPSSSAVDAELEPDPDGDPYVAFGYFDEGNPLLPSYVFILISGPVRPARWLLDRTSGWSGASSRRARGRRAEPEPVRERLTRTPELRAGPRYRGPGRRRPRTHSRRTCARRPLLHTGTPMRSLLLLLCACALARRCLHWHERGPRRAAARPRGPGADAPAVEARPSTARCSRWRPRGRSGRRELLGVVVRTVRRRGAGAAQRRARLRRRGRAPRRREREATRETNARRFERTSGSPTRPGRTRPRRSPRPSAGSGRRRCPRRSSSTPSTASRCACSGP